MSAQRILAGLSHVERSARLHPAVRPPPEAARRRHQRGERRSCDSVFVIRSGRDRNWRDAYTNYRANLGRGILLVLEILVGADIISTITAPLTLETVGLLGLVILIRTFLSFSLETEIEGCWPWRRAERQEDRKQAAVTGADLDGTPPPRPDRAPSRPDVSTPPPWGGPARRLPPRPRPRPARPAGLRTRRRDPGPAGPGGSPRL